MELFRTICRAINRIPFILQIILGMCLGVVLALIVPGDKVVVPVCGVLFVSALKAIAPLLSLFSSPRLSRVRNPTVPPRR